MTKLINKGFTLIELLIVMAILGVLAVVVLVAINPAEQLARTRDAGRVSAVTQIGHAIQAYYTAHNAAYPAAGATWGADLTNSGELSVIPASITAASGGACGTNAINGTWCYNTGVVGTVTQAITFARLESKSYNSKCSGATPLANILFSAVEGKGGTVCTAAATDPALAASYTFVP